jgi:hypothetical protein
MNAFVSVIWYVQLLALAILVAQLFFRHIWRTLPIFCFYFVWDLLVGNVLLYIINRYYPNVSFHIYFALVVIDSALQLCVLIELAWSVLRPIRASLSHTALALTAVLVLVAGAAIWPFAALSSLSQATTHEGLIFVQLQQTVSILRILFFLVLAGGSQLLSIGWRDRELQAATGFGIYSMVGIAVAIFQTHQTSREQYSSLQSIVAIAYICSAVYWIFSFAQQEAARREFTPQMRSFLLAAAGAARTARIGLDDSGVGKTRKPDDR